MSDDADLKKQRSRRNLAIGLGVAAFVVIVYLVTMLRIAQNVGAGT
jgi:hypothetical protein